MVFYNFFLPQLFFQAVYTSMLVFPSITMSGVFYTVLFTLHAVGKLRRRWVKNALSPVGVDMLRAIKDRVDPANIFGAGNLLPE